MNQQENHQPTSKKEKKKIYPFSIFIACLLFTWPILWIVVTLLNAYDLSFLPFSFETTDLLTLLFYSTFSGLFCRPLALKAMLSLVNASFFAFVLIVVLPFVQVTPLELLIKILYPLYPLSIF